MIYADIAMGKFHEVGGKLHFNRTTPRYHDTYISSRLGFDLSPVDRIPCVRIFLKCAEENISAEIKKMSLACTIMRSS